MPIEMPPFSKLYKQREGVDKFFYDKLCEVVDVVNAMNEGSTGKVNISVKDDDGAGVAGAKVTLTSGSDTYTSGNTGNAGGTSINNVPYGVYSVDIIVPEDYNKLASYSNVTVSSETTSVNLVVNKKTTESANAE